MPISEDKLKLISSDFYCKKMVIMVGQCPSLPPCISQGKTKEEAIACLKLTL